MPIAKKSAQKDAIVMYKGTDGVYITVPADNKLGMPHPGAALNQDRFEAGKTYYVSPAIGEELEERLEIYDEHTLRLLLSRINKKALAQLKDAAFMATEE